MIQNDVLYELLNEIDNKIDQRDYKTAKLLIEELQEDIDELSFENRLAIDLRISEIQYYADHNIESIDQLLVNLEKVQTTDTSRLTYKYNNFIGQVFKTSKNYKKSIIYHKKALSNAEKRNDTLDIIFSCLKIGRCFYRVEYINTPEYYENNLDSTLFYYNKALLFPQTSKNNHLFSRIYDNLSRIKMTTGDIEIAETYANRALEINKNINNSFGIAVSLSNLSNIYYIKNEHIKAIKSAQESNLFIKNKSLSIKRDNLEYISKNYEKLNDYKSAFHYLNETYKVSSIISKNTLNNKINAIEGEFNLAREKQLTLIEKNKRLKTQLILYSVLLLTIILLVAGVFLYKRNRTYKKRFEELINNQKNNLTVEQLETNSKKATKIPPEIVKSILLGLDNFEEKKEFLDKNLVMKDLAKKLKTNSSYLSKVINSYKNKNFAAYLNELRINHAIQELQNNKELQIYTIEGIAERMGYNNGESFSLAFRKITGLYPSYFIKQLKKQSH
ncbi:AraC family transcriptional regulator [uncultured Aquimarina sp.]|uniref:AraC family transcriptional regulator n=1 Tax=uncultured Aquimarina sp. TaxID=575652 RepID=UPI0026090982|nr:AraC family transcriptional regulator [uncultured Aquimarina sp.]